MFYALRFRSSPIPERDFRKSLIWKKSRLLMLALFNATETFPDKNSFELTNQIRTGQLTSLNAEIGESKAAGQRLGQVDILDGFKVRAGIDEHYLSRISDGLPAEFDFAGKTYNLITKKIFPEIRDGRFDVDLEFQNETPEGIRRGQTLHIRLELGDLAEAILLPRGGFYQKTGGQWVYVVDKSGTVATKRNIKLGRQNPQVFEVLEGLEVGEQVVTSSYDSFGDIDKLVLKK